MGGGKKNTQTFDRKLSLTTRVSAAEDEKEEEAAASYRFDKAHKNEMKYDQNGHRRRRRKRVDGL